MRTGNEDWPIAVLCSDLHLSLKPPVARSVEPDWLAAQWRMIRQVALAAGHESDDPDEEELPIFYCGDIFHSHDPEAELVNWAMKHLPYGYAIPGQHDLKHHVYKDIGKTAYATLVHAGKIANMIPRIVTRINQQITAVGMPWAYNDYHDLDIQKSKGRINLLIAHRYVWTSQHSYKNPPKLGRAGVIFAEVYEKFHCAAFGDNHDGFTQGNDTACTIHNCGCLIPRRSQERHYKPAVGMLWHSGAVTRRNLDTSEDKWLDAKLFKGKGAELDLEQFLEDLADLNEATLDFQEAVREVLTRKSVNSEVRRLVLQSLEK